METSVNQKSPLKKVKDEKKKESERWQTGRRHFQCTPLGIIIWLILKHPQIKDDEFQREQEWKGSTQMVKAKEWKGAPSYSLTRT